MGMFDGAPDTPARARQILFEEARERRGGDVSIELPQREIGQFRPCRAWNGVKGQGMQRNVVSQYADIDGPREAFAGAAQKEVKLDGPARSDSYRHGVIARDAMDPG